MTNCTADNRRALETRISALGLCVFDTALFLNTHPNCQEALDYFSCKKRELFELTEKYEEKYGPLTALSDPANDCWIWPESPWPWQTQDMCTCRIRKQGE